PPATGSSTARRSSRRARASRSSRSPVARRRSSRGSRRGRGAAPADVSRPLRTVSEEAMPTEVVLTTQGLERLERQIEQLKSERRREVADRLRHALEMGRELAENAEFLEAKEEQL